MNDDTLNDVAAHVERTPGMKQIRTDAWRSEGTGQWHTTVTMRDPETGSRYEIDIKKVA